MTKILTGVLVILFALAAASYPPPKRVLAITDVGQDIYEARCTACHQPNGEGIPGVFPPLARAEWVGEEKGRLIRIVLHGMTGETDVRGITYNGAMPPWGDILTDEQIAAVLTFVRSSWGNDAPPVHTDEVRNVRVATEGRTAPWTTAELSKAENLAVPGYSETEKDENVGSSDDM